VKLFLREPLAQLRLNITHTLLEKVHTVDLTAGGSDIAHLTCSANLGNWRLPTRERPVRRKRTVVKQCGWGVVDL